MERYNFEDWFMLMRLIHLRSMASGVIAVSFITLSMLMPLNQTKLSREGFFDVRFLPIFLPADHS